MNQENSINDLYLHFPNLLTKRNEGRVSTIRVPVEYYIQGSKQKAVNLANEIENEWKFTEIQMREVREDFHLLNIEYQVKPLEVDMFLKKVKYRKDLGILAAQA